MTMTVTIDKLSHDGRGIANIDGKTIFVVGALPGEVININYVKRRAKFDEAEVVKVISPSSDRIEPICKFYGICGGCSLQHLDPAVQIQHKQDVLAEQLLHFGKVQPIKWLEPLLADTRGYRGKARLGVRYVMKKGGALVGFRERNGRFLADMDYCEILHPEVASSIAKWRELITNLDAKRDIAQIEVAVGGERVAFVVRHLQPLSERDLASLREFAKMNHYWLYLQPKGPQTIHLFWPEQADQQLSYELTEFNVKIKFGPSDFTQVNSKINQQMIKHTI